MTGNAATIIDRVLRRAEDHPQHTALIELSTGGRTSYDDLVAHARSLADALSAVECRGRTILVALPRSAALVAAELGVRMAGAVPVIIGPDLPPSRVQVLIEASLCAGMVSLAGAPGGDVAQVVVPLRLRDWRPGSLEVVAGSERPLGHLDRREHDLLRAACYGVFTSGSTGTPKLVVVGEEQLEHLVDWYSEAFGLGGGVVVTAITSPAFDVHLMEVWTALVSGATVLVVDDDEDRLDPRALVDAVAQWAVEVVFLPTPLARAVVDELASRPDRVALRHVLIGGDRLDFWPPQLPGCTVHNQYGPAECTVLSSSIALDGMERTGLPPIGRMIGQLTARVVGADGVPVGRGELGELWIGGRGVGLGYLGRPELTAERFVTFEGERFYRTGDAVRMGRDGVLEFVARLDDQVKVRGFRVEPGEIEAVARSCRGVREAVVVADAAQGASRLVAFVVGDVAEAELRSFLSRRLPEYMVPSAVVRLDRMPLTPNDKVDRAGLRERAASVGADSGGAAAQEVQFTNDDERLLADIWSRVLGVAAVGPQDNFFDLGGHSLAAMRVVAIAREGGRQLRVADVLTSATLRATAGSLSRSGAASVLTPSRRSGPASPAQSRAFVEEAMSAGTTTAYQFQTAIHIEGPFDPERWLEAVAYVVKENDVLRTTYHESAQGLMRRVEDPRPLEIEVVQVDAADGIDPLERALRAHEEIPWDISTGPLVRWRLFRFSDERWVISQVEHHFVHDGWSLGLLLDQLMARYRGEPSTPSGTPEPSYGDWCDWYAVERDALRARSGAFWAARLDGVRPAGPVVIDGPAAAGGVGAVGSAAALHSVVTARTRSHLRSRFPHATEFALLAACFARALAAVRGHDDVVIGSAVAGRPDGADRCVGMFVNTICLRVRTEGPLDETVQAYGRELALALDHQVLPFDEVVRDWRAAHGVSEGLPFNTMFSMHNAAMPQLRLGDDARGRIEYRQNGTAKAPLDVVVIDRRPGVDLHEAEEPLLELVWEYGTAEFETREVRTLVELFERELAEAAGTEPEPVPMSSVAGVRVDHPGMDVLMRGILARRDVATALVADGRAWSWRELAAAVMAEPTAQLGHISVEERGSDFVVGALRHLHRGVPALAISRQQRARMEAAGADDLATVPGAAYGVLTSGSTGSPKLAVVSREGLANHVAGMARILDLTGEDVLMSCSAASFDAAWEEVLVPLATGAAVVVADLQAGIHGLLSQIRDTGTTVIGMPTALFHLLVDELADAGASLPPTLRCVVIGGERYDHARVRRWCDLPGAATTSIINTYGPAEATIGAFWHKLTHGTRAIAATRNTLGVPLDNVTARVVGADGVPVGRGELGELWIGGRGVGLGYLGRPELTAERFVTFEGERFYRTGDAVRMGRDGVLEFVARLDDQVKVRGFRVEPGEIEAVARSCRGVREAVVVADAAQGASRLVAFVVGDVAEAELRSFLSRRLPEYMVPSAVVRLDRMPLTPNDKVDRAGLRERAASVGADSGGAAAQEVQFTNDDERLLADIWSRVLGVAAVGPQDNFFDLGGHSLAAMRVVAIAREELGREVSLRDLLTGSDVRSVVAATAPVPAGRAIGGAP